MNSKSLVIAKKDFVDAAKSRVLWGAVLVLLVVIIPDFIGMINGDFLDSEENAIEFIPILFQYYVAPIAIITAYKSIVGERESGSVRVLFGHPTTRWDLVLGKFIGRAALLSAILCLATLGVGLVVLGAYGSLDVPLFVAIAGLIALYGTVWTGITVGISAAATSRLQAMASLLGLFMFFGPFDIWNRLAVPAFALVFTGSTSLSGFNRLQASTWPTWYRYVLRLNPMSNFVETRYYFVRLLDPSVSASGHHAVHLFGLSVLGVWCGGFLLFGYSRFERADLG